jgi:DNA (cytosine-5)-methyltransferase 1
MFQSEYIKIPCGLYLSADDAHNYMESLKRPKALDIFAGAGGMSLGLIKGGFEVVGAIDNWPIASITYMNNLGTHPCQYHFVDDSDYKALEKELNKVQKGREGEVESFPVSGSGWISNHPELRGVGHFWLGDVRKIKGKHILPALGLECGELDLVAGGPPCQGFSRGGKQDVMDPRNSLVFEFARLICELQPKTMMMENVPGIMDMVTPEGVPVVDAFCRILEDGGFGGLDASLRSLEHQTGAVGLLRSKGKKRKNKKVVEEKKKQKQLEFGFAC